MAVADMDEPVLDATHKNSSGPSSKSGKKVRPSLGSVGKADRATLYGLNG